MKEKEITEKMEKKLEINPALKEKTKEELLEYIAQTEEEMREYIMKIEGQNWEVEGVLFERSTDPVFHKGEDFVVLKKRIFQIQAISPKKIILKFYAGANSRIPDGIFHGIKKHAE